MYHPLPKAFLYTAYRFTVVFNDYGIRKTKSGTAFFVKDAQENFFVVTNRHVLNPSWREPAAEHWVIERYVFEGFDAAFTKIKFEHFTDATLVYPQHAGEDIAAFKCSRVTPIEPVGQKTFAINFLPINLLADDDYFQLLKTGDLVAMPGFPDWYDQSQGRPILRSGTLASDPEENYAGPGQAIGPRRRLVEAFSSGGSSGSPVFALSAGIRFTGDVVVDNMRPERLIGINAGHINAGGNGLHSGLSYMFTSVAIRELIDHAY